MSLKYLSLLMGAVVALTISTSASAQFTASVVPPRVKSKMDTTLKQDSVRRATVALAARVTDMKKWVDSAAGVSIPTPDSTALARASITDSSAKTAVLKDSVMINRNARVRADSAASIGTVEVHDSTGLKGDAPAAVPPPTASARSSSNRSALPDTTTMSAAGTPAPATASMLPLLAIVGVTTFLAGAALRRS